MKTIKEITYKSTTTSFSTPQNFTTNESVKRHANY